MLVFRAGIQKTLVRMVNREDPDQTDFGLRCLSRPFWQATCVHNCIILYCHVLRTFSYTYWPCGGLLSNTI